MKTFYYLMIALSVIFASCDSSTDTKKSSSSRAQTTKGRGGRPLSDPSGKEKDSFVEVEEKKNGGGDGADDTDDENPTKNVSDPRVFAQSITVEDLRRHLQTIASDDYAGRPAGSKKTRRYLRRFYRDNTIESPLKDTYYQTIPKKYIIPKLKEASLEFPYDTYIQSLLKHEDKLTSDRNVIAYIKGKQNPEEVVIITAHMDHIGTTCDNPMETTCENVEIYNGANDNGSGTVALLEIAQAFQHAKESGNIPKRSVMFVHFALEEAGLIGSQYYVDNPVFDLENTVLNLNLDAMGRSFTDRNYIYIFGADEISSELKSIHEEINKKYVSLDLDYSTVADRSRLIKLGDHFIFIKAGIPALFYFSGTDDMLHETTDDADHPTLHYETLAKRTKLVFHTAWEFANREKRLVRDREYKP